MSFPEVFKISLSSPPCDIFLEITPVNSDISFCSLTAIDSSFDLDVQSTFISLLISINGKKSVFKKLITSLC